MRVFLITLAMSIGLTVLFWNLGLANRIWPAHPMLLLTLVAAACGIAIQALLPRDRAAEKRK